MFSINSRLNTATQAAHIHTQWKSTHLVESAEYKCNLDSELCSCARMMSFPWLVCVTQLSGELRDDWPYNWPYKQYYLERLLMHNLQSSSTLINTSDFCQFWSLLDKRQNIMKKIVQESSGPFKQKRRGLFLFIYWFKISIIEHILPHMKLYSGNVFVPWFSCLSSWLCLPQLTPAASTYHSIALCFSIPSFFEPRHVSVHWKNLVNQNKKKHTVQNSSLYTVLRHGHSTVT